ncbi:sigma-54-dependent Fis family transcriptional regulator [Pseudonocardia alni]|uniref:sigma-54-dependent Fis family transcriptional regulator n=1 Tax=Pseudonocardia alni TaxID=33907 RepID=UPI00280BA1DB|nr:helix-turn-helix domain-containing protein [Pseudonocardia alni]
MSDGAVGSATEDHELIRQSWRRSMLSGVDPRSPVDSLPQVEVDEESGLLRAAAPVLSDLEGDLAGQRFGVILADERSRIVDRRVGSREVGRRLDGIRAARGTVYAEEIVGTTSLGTVSAIGGPLSVIGEQHFNESLKTFCCFGAPIRNRLTGRLAGVLDICAHVSDREMLFAPLVRGAVRHIEQRLADQAGAGSHELVSDYRLAFARRRGPLVAVCDEFTLASPDALDLLAPADYALLAETARTTTGRPGDRRLALTAGAEVRVGMKRLPGGGSLFRLQEIHRDPVGPGPAGTHTTGTPIVVRGEPGTGRTTRALELVGPHAAQALDAADVAVLGDERWSAALSAVRPDTGLVVENIDLLPDGPATALVALLRTDRPTATVLTYDTGSPLTGRQQSLVGLCDTRFDLAPLRRRRDELPDLLSRILDVEGRPGALRLSRSATVALLGYPWPGNLHELVTAARHILRSRTSGSVTVSDLPSWCHAPHTRGLSRLEQVEREAIVDALARHRGHRANAADHLGISHRTIYNRMRALRILDSEYAPPA